MIRKLLIMVLVIAMMLQLTVGCTTTGTTKAMEQTNDSEAIDGEKIEVNGEKASESLDELNEITICESWGFETGFSSVVIGESLGIFYYLGNFYETLVNYEDGKIVPGLAERWEIDGNDITFYLRQNVKFSDGTPFNAEVVKKNFQMIPKMLGEMYVGIFGKVLTILEEVEVVDEYTVKLKLSRPYYGVLQDLAMLRPMAMMSPNAFTEDGASDKLLSATMGTGPYMLDSIEDNRSYTFVKNPHYWGKEPDVDKFTIKVIPDNQSKALALRSGEIDMIMGANKVSYDSFNEFKSDKNYCAKISNVDTKTRYFVINTSVAPFNDEKVRLAMNLVVDKDMLCNDLLYGIEPKADHLLSPSLPYCDIKLTPYEYDIEKAKSLLEEAGWIDEDDDGIREKDGKKLDGEILYRQGMGVEEEIVLAYVSALKKAGFNMSISGLEMMTWYTDLAGGTFKVAYNETYGIPYDPYSTINNLSGQGADLATKQILPNNEKADAKILELQSISDANKIQEIYNFILKSVHENSSSIPVSYMKELVIFNKERIDDYNFNGQPSNVDIAGITLK